MIELAIEHDDDTLLADGHESPMEAPAGALEETYFVVPTRFAVDGRELLAYPGVHETWRPLPLLGFGPRLRDSAFSVREGGTATVSLADGGSLHLRPQGEIVLINASLTGDQVSVAADELVTAAAVFAADVCDYLQSVLPALVTHPGWTKWRGVSR
jgi:hypothetical protein